MTEMILLSEAQMARISPFFPRSHGVPRVDDRGMISGIIFVLRNEDRLLATRAAFALDPRSGRHN